MLYFKELYKLGKKKKAHRTCLYAILNRGYQISSFEYHICYVTTRCQDQYLGYQLLEEFKKECVNFATAAEAFGKLSIFFLSAMNLRRTSEGPNFLSSSSFFIET